MIRFLRPFSPASAGGAPPDGSGGFGSLYLARLSMFGFGMTALAMSFTIIILPTRILDVAPEESKNTYLGVLSFVGLMIAVIVQPVVGGLSDRARTRWGRRAPFIMVGTVASLPLIVAVGVAPSYVLLFVFICALQLTSNSAQGPYQGVIRDLIPQQRRGAASGMKTLVEVAGALIITGVIGVLMGRYEDTDNFLWVWAATGLLAATIVPGAIVTSTTVARATPRPTEERREEPADDSTKAHPDYKWFLGSRFLIATAAASMGTFALFFLEDSVGLENPAQELWKLLPVMGAAVLLGLSRGRGGRPARPEAGDDGRGRPGRDRRGAAAGRRWAGRRDGGGRRCGSGRGNVSRRELGHGHRPGLDQAHRSAARVSQPGYRRRGRRGPP
ncbi:MAG: MFS transporter [Chloroflexi bacterium]|nr:MFS transporter [Chloroflexota bacterium]